MKNHNNDIKSVCAKDKCNGCRACVDICPVGAIDAIEELFYTAASIDEKKCLHCDMCKKVCPNIKTVVKREPIQWMRGWSKNDEIRHNSSSGGVATSIMKSFVESGGYVCTCLFADSSFGFVISNNFNELTGTAGSKYVKSNAHRVYSRILELLQHGNKVLLIALPCQVAAAKNYIDEQYGKNFYTVDLICHGTPSQKLLEIFLNENNWDLKSMDFISFRSKKNFLISTGKKYLAQPGTMDYYSTAYINGLSYTYNCYSCEYASYKRVADISLGDSWRIDQYRDELAEGISIILCMDQKGMELLKQSEIVCVPDDKKEEIRCKPELSHPTRAPKTRERFIRTINRGFSFRFCVKYSLPYQCIRQRIKGCLIRFGLYSVIDKYMRGEQGK